MNLEAVRSETTGSNSDFWPESKDFFFNWINSFLSWDWDGRKQKRRGQLNDHAFAQSFTALIYRDTPPSISSFLYVDRDREWGRGAIILVGSGFVRTQGWVPEAINLDLAIGTTIMK